MLGVGECFPTFSLTACITANEGEAFPCVSSDDYAGRWKVFVFWPKDFADFSLSELLEFGELDDEFRRLGAQLVGCSVESVEAHRAWRQQEPELRRMPIPLLGDTRRDLCGQLGILDEASGVAQRATFIVDTDNVIRFVYVTTDEVSRDAGEVLRVLHDLRRSLD